MQEESRGTKQAREALRYQHELNVQLLEETIAPLRERIEKLEHQVAQLRASQETPHQQGDK